MYLVLGMMYTEDARSEFWSGFVCNDTKGSVNQPKQLEPRFWVVHCTHLLQ